METIREDYVENIRIQHSTLTQTPEIGSTSEIGGQQGNTSEIGGQPEYTSEIGGRQGSEIGANPTHRVEDVHNPQVTCNPPER